MRQIIPRLFTFVLIALLFSSCSDPVKVGSGNDVAITDVWITDFVDIDSDSYGSYARLNFEVTVDEPSTLYAIVSQRSGAQYTFYKQTVPFDVDGSRTLWIALGDEGYEIPMGCYDVALEIFDVDDSEANDVLADRAAENDADMQDVCMESPEEDLSLTPLTFNNECPTDVIIEITGHSSITVLANSSNTYYFSGNPGTITFNGATQLSEGRQNLTWTNRSVDLTTTASYRLWYGESLFFATVANTSGSALSDFYINYELEDEYYLDIILPNDGIAHPLGYYGAHGDETEIWAFSTGEQLWYYWSFINFPGGDNQVVSLTHSLLKAPAGIVPSGNRTNEKLSIEAQ